MAAVVGRQVVSRPHRPLSRERRRRSQMISLGTNHASLSQRAAVDVPGGLRRLADRGAVMSPADPVSDRHRPRVHCIRPRGEN